MNIGQDLNYCQSINDTTISIIVLSSAFHNINANFGIKVDNNFVKSKISQEPLIGISEGLWNFTVCKVFYY